MQFNKMKNLNSKVILKEIENNKGVIRIGLFGSFIKNKQNKKRDIDLLVKFKEPNFDNYAELLILLEKIFKRKIDLITETQLRPELLYIKKEAKYLLF